jgi:parallel beta-helix repeat protein
MRHFVIALILFFVAARASAGPISVTNTTDSAIGSLRDAINNANAAPDHNDIVFSIAGPGPWTIHLLSPLPAITSDLSILGSSAAGYVANSAAVGLPMNGTMRIEIDGTSAGLGASALTFLFGASVDGIAINNCSGPAITVSSDNVSISRCYLGTDLTGLLARPNNVGVLVSASNGSFVNGSLISGNTKRGIELLNSGQCNIASNYVGTDKTGAAGLANGDSGIWLHDGSNHNTIGFQPANNCTLPTFGPNVIAFNAGDGIEISSGAASTGNRMASNMIFSNAGLGVDLEGDGVTGNDNLDPDTGANLRQNFPVLVSIGGNTIHGYLRSAASSVYDVQFFWNPTCDPSTNGEGKQYLGHASGLATDGSGIVIFTFTCGTIPAGGFITALATDANGNTSEFSKCMSSPPTAVTENPPAFALGANMPNPFNPSTIIPYRVSRASRVHLAIYDARGALVRTLVDGVRDAGAWSVGWNGEDWRGVRAASGVYFYRLRSGSFDETRKMVLLK